MRGERGDISSVISICHFKQWKRKYFKCLSFHLSFSFQLLLYLNITIPLTLNKHILDSKTYKQLSNLMTFFKRNTRTSTHTSTSTLLVPFLKTKLVRYQGKAEELYAKSLRVCTEIWKQFSCLERSVELNQTLKLKISFSQADKQNENKRKLKRN